MLDFERKTVACSGLWICSAISRREYKRFCIWYIAGASILFSRASLFIKSVIFKNLVDEFALVCGLCTLLEIHYLSVWQLINSIMWSIAELRNAWMPWIQWCRLSGHTPEAWFYMVLTSRGFRVFAWIRDPAERIYSVNYSVSFIFYFLSSVKSVKNAF